MNRGYGWSDPLFPFGGVWKRWAPEDAGSGHPRPGFECCFCGRVFKRKHVRWSDNHWGGGWICRDRCERTHKGMP